MVSRPAPGGLQPWVGYWPVAVGLLALCAPSLWDLARGYWDQEEGAHGPIVLAIVLWVIWRSREAYSATPTRPVYVSGIGSFAFGLLCYVVGRSQGISPLEVGSIIPILIGTVLLVKGWAALRTVAFPILFLVFLIPLPGLIVTAITGPLKQNVSAVVESFLYAAGYPIARTGVVLSIGPYRLLVADACSGLNSMYSLSALGLLYLYLMRYRDWWRVGPLLASVIPIAFAANIVRVLILVLVTYHLGDAAGQSFLHGFAGFVVFVVALMLLFAFDKLLGLFRVFGRGGNPRAGRS